MKKTALISLVCAIALLVCAIPTTAVAKTGLDFPWTSTSTLLEQIVERDGLIDGIWYPWLVPGHNSHSLAGNEVMAKYYGEQYAAVALDEFGADRVYRQIYNLKTMGYNMMAYGGSMYGEGVIFDDYGDVLGVKEEFLTNMRRLLNMCREIGMPVMWNIYFHASALPDYNGMDAWYFLSRMLGDRTVADHYAQRFVKPVCQVLAEYPDVVALVSIADEPENEINDSEIGNHSSGGRAMYGVNEDDMVYFMQGINNVCKQVLPNVPRTVASNNVKKTICRDFDLDLMGHNRYDSNANIHEVEAFFTDADIILTEYNIGGDANITEEQFFNLLKTFREKFMSYGYKGGFQWCWLPQLTDAAYYLLRNKSSDTAFKETVTLLRHYIDDYRAAHRGETVVLDTPVLYANDGTGLVEWIPSRQATKMVIERSDDGKTWTKVLETTDPNSYVTYGKGVYKDTTASGSGFSYRITVTDDKGNTVTSAPNNKAGADKAHKKDYTFAGVDYPTNIAYEKSTLTKDQAKLTSFAVAQNRPAKAADNLIKDGDFETVNSQWNNGNFTKYAAAVSDKTAVSGSKSLFFNTSAVSEGAFYTFTVSGLQKNTNYTLSTWIKGDYMNENNLGYGSFGVMDPDTGKYMVYWEYYRDYARCSRLTRQIYPTAWDNEWHLRAVQFNSGDSTEVTLALYGYGTRMWLDDMALYRSDAGVGYAGDKVSARLRYYFTVDCATCEPNKSVLQNLRMDDGKSTFWQSGQGWRNGTLSFVDNKYEYGRSLKYTASDDPVGNYYIKWVEVEPNTEYVFSGSIKILESGGGKFGLVEDHPINPLSTFAIEFDADAFADAAVDGWFNFAVRFNTSAYTTLGVSLCDLGGVALMDNVRLFKVSDAKAVTDPYKDESGNAVAPPSGTCVVIPTTSATTRTEDTTTTTAVEGEADITLPTETAPTTSAPAAEDAPTHSEENTAADAPNLLWLWIVLAILLIGGGVAVFLILRKKKSA